MRPGIRLLTCVTLLCAAGSSAYTTKTGNVSGQTWSAGTYYISGSLSVTAGSTLTIEAGAVVKAPSSPTISINGTLIALGSAAQPIIFTSRDDDSVGEMIAGSDGVPAPGDWRGINLNGYLTSEGVGLMTHCRLRFGGNTAAGAAQANVYFNYSDSARVEHCVFEQSLQSGLRINNASPLLRDNLIQSNGTNGVSASGAGAPQIRDCVFTGNTGYAAYLDDVNPGTCGGNSGSGNGTNGLGLSGVVTDGQALWANAAGFPYVLIGALTVESPTVFTLKAGVTMKAVAASSITVKGTLDCEGVGDSLVVVTSVHDDSIDGDTNGNGAATSPAPGDWRGIFCNGYGDYIGAGNFDWTRLCYGGHATGSADADLYFSWSDSGRFAHSSCETSSQVGLKMSDCTPLILASAFAGNLGHGVHGSGGDSGPVHDCVFTGNGGYGGWLAGDLSSYGGNGGSGNLVNGIGINGSIAADQAWLANAAGFAYVLSGTPDVLNNVVLSLGPGVVVKGAAGGSLLVRGTLVAAGTADSPVVFTSIKDDSQGGDVNGDGAATSPAPGDWQGMECNGFGDYDGIAHLDWCRLAYGGNAAGAADANLFLDYCDESWVRNCRSDFSQQDGIRIETCVPEISGSSFQGNGRHGVYAGNSTTPVLQNCAFTGNAGAGAWFQTCQVTDMGGCSGSGNGVNGIKLVGGSTNGSLIWGPTACLPFLLSGSVIVSNTDTLYMTPGAIVKGESGATLEIQGTLSAIGTEAEPIVFTSSRDDQWGGDTNGDGAATLPARGDWTGVYCNGFNAATMGCGDLQFCRLRYGGAGVGSANLRFYDSDAGLVKRCVSELGLGAGVRITGSSPVIESCHVVDNSVYGVRIESGAPNLGTYNGDNGGYNVFTGNLGGFQVWNASTSEIDACYNDWGVYTEEEIDALIRDDDESAGTGVVDFYPWIRNDGAPLVTRFIVTDESVSLTWTPVNSADRYVVSSCDTPYGTFVEDGTGVFNNNRWSAPLPAGWRFYQVRAVTD